LNIDELYARFTKDEESFLSFMERIFLYTGFNYWNKYAARLIGFTVRVKEEFNGVIPEDPDDIMSIQGVSTRKILMLLMQSAGFKKPASFCWNCKRYTFRGCCAESWHVL
jgi:adenine-specific DNA glycosylase